MSKTEPKEVECHNCGNEYKNLGMHWSAGSCDYPSFSNHQREIIVGLVMGDGSIGRNGKNPHLEVGMISPNYLRYLDTEFGSLGCGVSLMETAEESAKSVRESGFDPYAKAENYSDVYRWRTRSHPELHEFADWYSSGNKVWPSDIQLTPTVLKHWFVGDGSYVDGGSHNYIRISMANEVDNTDKIDQMFSRSGLPTPKYDIYEGKCIARFTVDDSHTLWEYIGEPLPDFEYKWPAGFS